MVYFYRSRMTVSPQERQFGPKSGLAWAGATATSKLRASPPRPPAAALPTRRPVPLLGYFYRSRMTVSPQERQFGPKSGVAWGRTGVANNGI